MSQRSSRCHVYPSKTERPVFDIRCQPSPGPAVPLRRQLIDPSYRQTTRYQAVKLSSPHRHEKGYNLPQEGRDAWQLAYSTDLL